MALRYIHIFVLYAFLKNMLQALRILALSSLSTNSPMLQFRPSYLPSRSSSSITGISSRSPPSRVSPRIRMPLTTRAHQHLFPLRLVAMAAQGSLRLHRAQARQRHPVPRAIPLRQALPRLAQAQQVVPSRTAPRPDYAHRPSLECCHFYWRWRPAFS